MTGVGAAPSLLWFRQDLRLADNPALSAALERRSPVIPVFIWAPEEEGDWPPGAASRWWLHHSLANLSAELEKRGSRLIIRRGPTEAALRRLVADSGASAVLWNRRYEPAAVARDREVKSKLRESGVTAENFNGSLLFEPWTIRNSSEQPFRVFTPFWRACLTKPLTASRNRSRLRNLGRACFRLKTASCWRRATTSRPRSCRGSRKARR